MSEKPRLDRLRALAESNPRLQQHGQGEDNEVHDGTTACTHAICQFLSLAWNGDVPTLNEVNRMAGMDPNARGDDNKPRGMRPGELETFLNKAKIPMALRHGLTFADLLKASDDGPVFYAMRYGSAPKRTKMHPNGTTQTGKRVPDTRHAVVMLGHLTFPGAGGGPTRTEVYRKDPNHGSKNRPELPPYDTISDRQARIEYEDYKKKLKLMLSAALPTRPMPVIGAFKLPPVQPPPLVVVDLEPFSGTATVKGDGHSAVQIADRQFISLLNGATKRVIALGRLQPRLPGPAGNRRHVAIVGEEAAILLRADITLTTDGGIEIPAPVGEDEELVPIGAEIAVPAGDVPSDLDNTISNAEFPLD
jgi:hypothetical protein